MIKKRLKLSILFIPATPKALRLIIPICIVISISCTNTPKLIGPDGYSVTINHPLNGDTVSRVVILAIDVSDVENTSRVSLFVDGIARGANDRTHPFHLSWNTRDYTNREHTVQVNAYDLDNQLIGSESVKVHVLNSLELNRILYQNNSFIISWPKSGDSDFNSYVLYEAFSEDLSDAQRIHITLLRANTSFTVTGVVDDEFRYYKLAVLDRNGIEIETSERRGSSYINIAFVSYRAIDYEIYIMDIDGENQTNLTNNQSWDTNPVFSPDGSKIAFFSDRDGPEKWSLFIMDIDGSNLIKITENLSWNGMPKFSPNGSKIVYVGLEGGLHNIFLINSDGMNKTRLTNRVASDFAPQFFSHGSKIVFVNRDFGSDDIFIMNLDGSNQIKLSNDGSTSSPTISPDNSKIAFSSWSYGIAPKIVIMASDGSNPTRISPSGAVQDEAPIYSPDGSKILFLSKPNLRSENFNIYVMDIDGSNRIDVSNGLNRNFHPQFSSDGSKVVFTSGFANIYSVNVDGSNLTELTTTGGINKKARFQPRN